MHSLKYFRLVMPILVIACLQSTAQSSSDQKKQDEYVQMKSLIDSKKYHFHARSATTMKGKTIQLTTDYGLKLSNDSLMVDLPYYGQAYSVDYGGTDLGIQFNTSQFSYMADSAKRGGWNITIIPKNESKASKIIMYVSPSGYCNVQITSNSRQPISYYGMINAFNDR